MDGPSQGRMLISAVQLSLLVTVLWLRSAEALPLGGFNMSHPGLWSEWGAWSSCTRTCGTGVSVQKRMCITGSCVGRDKQYRSCCVELCPLDSPSFRAIQCSSFNNLSFHNWKPLEEGKEVCELSCVGNIPSALLVVDDIADGTPCRTSDERAPGVCVDGMCARVGCDGVLGSKKEENGCLQCAIPGEAVGEGVMECVKHADVTTGNTLATTGYLQILLVSKGAMNIKVTHTHGPKEPDHQGHLAIRNTATPNIYYLLRGAPSGHYTLSGGVVFSYTVSNHTETFLAVGPLTEDITVELYMKDASSQIIFEFYTLKQKAEPQEEVPNQSEEIHSLHDDELNDDNGFDGTDFEWSYGEFSECSVTCGTGVRTSHALCRDLDYPDRDIPETFCLSNDLPRPFPIWRHCCKEPCPSRWKLGPWTPCSAACGTGNQERVVECVRMTADGEEETLASSLCDGEKPVYKQDCSQSQCQAQWWEGEWGECSVPCGPGVQERSVVCQGLAGDTVHQQLCSHSPKPSASQECNLVPCTECSWWSSRWSKCNDSCGSGIQTRRNRCRYPNGKRAPDGCCDDQLPPATESPCYDTRRCEFNDWTEEPFGECVGACGSVGTRHREISCVGIMGGKRKYFPDSFCNVTIKPSTTLLCTPACCEWATHEWSECSKTCGAGLRDREITCMRNGQPAECCDEDTKPSLFGVCIGNPTCEPPWCEDDTESGIDCELIARIQLCGNDYYSQVCCETCMTTAS